MSETNRFFSKYPSSMYVFLVFALATFMLSFAVIRSPGLRYEAAVTLVHNDVANRAFSPAELQVLSEQASQQCMAPEFIQAALDAAGLVPVSVIDTVHDITGRMNVSYREFDSVNRGIQITLQTPDPEQSLTLLDGMTALVQQRAEQSLTPSKARIVAIRGGSVTSVQLIWLGVLSFLVGSIAVWYSELARPSSVMFTENEVTKVAGLPVVLNLDVRSLPDESNLRTQRQNWLKLGLTITEVGLAAVFLLMLYHLAVTNAFTARIFSDPLAAYGEALARLMA